MISDLEATCDVTKWTGLTMGQKMKLQLQAFHDPVFFWNHPSLGNLPLWPSQAKHLSKFSELREDGKRRYSEMIFVSGMRGGKTSTASCISLTEIYKMLMMESPAEHFKLARNSEIQCINVAPSEPQALDTVFRRVKELVANSPYFMSFIPDSEVVYNAIRFPKNLTVKALGSSSGSGVGRTVKCFVADEVSSFMDNANKRGASEVYNRLSKSTATFKPWNENIRVAISSPLYEGDFITQLHHSAVEENWEWAYTIWEATWDLNPNLTMDVLAEERKKDPISFDRDFGAQAVAQIDTFFTLEAVMELQKRFATKPNLFIGEPDPKSRNGFWPEIDFGLLHPAPDAIEYYVGTDPSIKGDGFGLAVGYLNTSDQVIITGSTVFKAAANEQLSTSDIRDFMKPIFEALPVQDYLFDIYFHSELQTLARGYQNNVIQHHLTLNDWALLRNDLYRETAVLPHSEYLFKELRELQLIRNTKVDHPATGSKDAIDAVCQIISHARRKQEEARMYNRAVNTFTVATY